jgi:hypothetical protein
MRVEPVRPNQAEPGIELVDRAVGLDARRVFSDARAAEQRSLTGIAGSRVDFHCQAFSCQLSAVSCQLSARAES